ncbi:MAG TPA: MlaD family protein [Solirubrobacteraceae bacterium]|nr:MlaD family protein [Solirubrobacteraceae bacterium]
MRRRPDPEVVRRRNVALGLVLLAAAAVGLFWAFTRPHPLAHPYRLRAVVTSATGVHPGLTPVRIAGVEVGRVAKVTTYDGTRNSLLTMNLDHDVPPIRTDATLKVRPRLFLEGNAFIDLQPGTPRGRNAPSGYMVPLRNTSIAVSLPHVLGALTSDTRTSLKRALQALGTGFRFPAHGVTGGKALNNVLREGARMLPDSAIVADATAGTQRDDLSKAIDGFGRAAEGLDSAGPHLSGLLAHLRQTNAAFASESRAVTETVRQLPGALASTRAAALRLRSALPPALALTRATDDALPALPAALSSGVPWLGHLQSLLSPDELGGDLEDLVPATRSLAAAQSPATGLFTELDRLSQCANGVLTPTATARIADGPRTSGTSTWSEFLSMLVGLNSTAQSFDGNGPLIRGLLSGGATRITTGTSRQQAEPLYGNALSPPLGTRPAASVPAAPSKRDVACSRNRVPDLNGPAAAIGPADGSANGGR